VEGRLAGLHRSSLVLSQSIRGDSSPLSDVEKLYQDALKTSASMLSGVQQHPDPPRRRTREDSRKHTATTKACVVFLGSRIFHGARTVERQVLMRGLGRRHSVEVGAPCTGLNPKVHLSVVDDLRGVARAALARCEGCSRLEKATLRTRKLTRVPGFAA